MSPEEMLSLLETTRKLAAISGVPWYIPLAPHFDIQVMPWGRRAIFLFEPFDQAKAEYKAVFDRVKVHEIMSARERISERDWRSLADLAEEPLRSSLAELSDAYQCDIGGPLPENHQKYVVRDRNSGAYTMLENPRAIELAMKRIRKRLRH